MASFPDHTFGGLGMRLVLMYMYQWLTWWTLRWLLPTHHETSPGRHLEEEQWHKNTVAIVTELATSWEILTLNAMKWLYEYYMLMLQWSSEEMEISRCQTGAGEEPKRNWRGTEGELERSRRGAGEKPKGSWRGAEGELERSRRGAGEEPKESWRGAEGELERSRRRTGKEPKRSWKKAEEELWRRQDGAGKESAKEKQTTVEGRFWCVYILQSPSSWPPSKSASATKQTVMKEAS